DNLFWFVNKHQRTIYVQIRIYNANAIRYFPTNRGISLKKREFVDFISAAAGFRHTIESEEASKILFINSTLAVSHLYNKDGESKITFLKGNEIAKCISLSVTQFQQLCDAHAEIL